MFKLKYLLILTIIIMSMGVVSAQNVYVDSLENEKINITINKSHISFNNNYLNLSLEHVDFFVPQELLNQLILVTPCDPNLMTCQGPNGYFHVLNDWTNDYSDKFYIKTDYLFNYEEEYWNPGNNIPEGFGYKRINKEIRLNYTKDNKGLEQLLNTRIQVDNDKFIKINLSSHYEVLIIKYTFINNDIVVSEYTDIYKGKKPDLLPSSPVVTSKRGENITTMKYYIDNKYKEERNINITIGFPKNKEENILFDYNYEIKPNKYEETINYLKTISEAKSELENPQLYDFRSFNVILEEDKINKYEFNIKNENNEINTLGTWIQGSGSGGTGNPLLDIFTGVGLNGAVRWSDDGTSWTTSGSSGNTAHILAVDFSEKLEMFVAVGYNDITYNSEDGKTWTIVDSGLYHFWDIIWSEELEIFVATGNSGRIKTSTDGVTWTYNIVGSSSLYDVAWSPELELFVVVGTNGVAHTSSDGYNWNSLIGFGSTTMTSVEWSPELGLFSVVGVNGAAYWSDDGLNWNSVGAGSTTLDANVWSPELGMFVATGRNGAVRRSVTGKTWTTSGTAGSSILWAVTYSPELELFVAGGSGDIYTSTDGVTWTNRGSPSATIRGISWGYIPPPTQEDTCTCPGINNNWEINMSDGCFLNTNCDLGTGKLSFIDTGNFTINATLNINSNFNLSNNQIIYIKNNAILTI